MIRSSSFLQNAPAPRKGPNAEAKGSYQIATRIGRTSLNPGETLDFEQFITGYGEIRSAKIACYISSEIFNKETSHVTSSLYERENANGENDILWGSEQHNISDIGYTLNLSGIQLRGWKERTLFIDVDDSTNRVLTEVKLEKAPFEFKLTTLASASPGMHYLDFYLIYFNGSEWVSQKERVAFKINNKFEKNSDMLSMLAALALTVTIIKDGISPVVGILHEIGKLVSRLHTN
ncbi:hypothetical protein JC795_32130 [Pseudomonas veronii]|uniref:hypothetical protein n=1 Tax=Pseudomonas veronii TaxID=76761 RepID=UPI0018E873E6|nr:hypothetical protein [Pseudomonas veronii]MBJ2182826.1 hypothetical protein [Pseudomonas veronii]